MPGLKGNEKTQSLDVQNKTGMTFFDVSRYSFGADSCSTSSKFRCSCRSCDAGGKKGLAHA
jgi:hypothetical protein